MIRRWILYLAVVLGCIGIYWVYQEWLGWVLLITVLCLPVLGLLVSLPAMLGMRIKVRGPSHLPMGTAEQVGIEVRCPVPAPPYKVKLVAHRTITGESWHLQNGDPLPVDHCGQLECRMEKAVVYDYLGLFCLHIMGKKENSVIIRPREVKINLPTNLERFMSTSWRPKPGGGFAENHELRQYRPGDNLNQVHWKMTAKTGKLIIREAMEPTGNLILVTMDLCGDADELDRKFGQLLHVGKELLQQGLKFDLQVLTGKGVRTFTVNNEQELISAQDMLLSTPPARIGTILGQQKDAAWQYHVGGGAGEA